MSYSLLLCSYTLKNLVRLWMKNPSAGYWNVPHMQIFPEPKPNFKTFAYAYEIYQFCWNNFHNNSSSILIIKI